jgi:copper homeostasis protein
MIRIEAAVESLDGALAAAAGGAHRIELCTDLAHGGTTPDVQLIRDCRSQLIIPIFVLVRPRAGDFVYTAAEHQTMIEQIHQAKDAGARGIVTGALTRTQPSSPPDPLSTLWRGGTKTEVAEDRTAELIDAARPLPVTFHRAFDACPDLAVALERLIHLGADRVLTSGGAPTASEGAARISRLRIQADRRIEIVAGGGIDAHNVARLVHDTAVREVHFSVREAEKVRAVVANL